MEKLIFFISTVIMALLPNCYSSDVHTVPARSCIFGPFKDTAMSCWLQEGKFTGCIMKDFNWFFDGSNKKYLSKRKVLNSFAFSLKNEEYRDKVDALVKQCVEKANLYDSNRTQKADKLIRCFDDNQAFNDIFPKAFCRDDNRKSVPATQMSVVVNCAWGPFEENSKRCYFSTGIHSDCMLEGLDFFTEDHKVNITKVLDTIDACIINSEHKEDVHAVMRKCVDQANSVDGTQSDVGSKLTSCWNDENVYLRFVDAFCPKIN